MKKSKKKNPAPMPHTTPLKSPRTDPDGSYTGTVADHPYEKPVQDADDL